MCTDVHVCADFGQCFFLSRVVENGGEREKGKVLRHIYFPPFFTFYFFVLIFFFLLLEGLILVVGSGCFS